MVKEILYLFVHGPKTTVFFLVYVDLFGYFRLYMRFRADIPLGLKYILTIYILV